MRVRRAGVTWRTMRISYPRVNVGVGDKEERMLITGLHTVADIFCNVCLSVLGWKYLEAYEETQKYKENKYIIEKVKMIKVNGWT
mmetsp:Transcript_10102/g.30859  ORF Transcript_10102/g.30859 Transcript_10102/m.30859 type:complete len:85 (+) Transcript_10102:195-449(+)